MVTSTINTTTWTGSLAAPYGRGVFFAAGRFWAFFQKTTTSYYFSSSPDGITWDPPTVFNSKYLHWDGTYVHIYRSQWYRRGIPKSDGTIEWEPERRFAYIYGGYGNITTDSEGYPWIIYCSYVDGNYKPFVYQATQKDGSAWNAPVNLDTLRGYHAQLIPLTNKKIYAIWYRIVSPAGLKGKLFDGESWEETETHIGNCYQGFTQSAVAIGDTIYLAYLLGDYVRLKTWTPSAGWSDAEIVNPDNYCNVCFCTISKDGPNIYVIWTKQNKIFYRKKTNGTTWEDTVEWITEPVTIDQMDYNSSYEASEGKIQFIWLDDSSPQNIRHDWLPGIPIRKSLLENLTLGPKVLLVNDTFAQAYKMVVRLPMVGRVLMKVKEEWIRG